MLVPRVAVVLPVYNVALYLAECLDAFSRQLYENFVVYAINDGSTDDSVDVLSKYEKKYSWLKVYSQKNKGAASARNCALQFIEEEHTFDYIVFSDSDDLVSPEYISDYVSYAQKYSADCVICGYKSFTRNGDVIDWDINEYADEVMNSSALVNLFFHLGKYKKPRPYSSNFLSNRMYRAEVIKGVRFKESLKTGEDLEYAARLLSRLRVGVAFSKLNYQYRLRASSLSNSGCVKIEDLELFSGMLSSRDYIKEAYVGIEKFFFDAWWRLVKEAARTDDKYYFLKCEEYFPLLKQISCAGVPYLRFKKRLCMFRLGMKFLSCYFYLLNRGGEEQKVCKEDYYP